MKHLADDFDGAFAFRLIRMAAELGNRTVRHLVDEGTRHCFDLLLLFRREVAAAKQLIAEVATRTATSATDYTIDAIADRRVSPEGQEGMSAFLAKRPPSWISRGSS